MSDVQKKIEGKFSILERVCNLTNKQKPFLNFFCPWEDALFGSIKNFFQSQKQIEKNRKSIIKQHLIEFCKVQKEAATNIKQLLNERNSISQEYYKAKMYLMQKKNKKLELDHRLWELDFDLLKKYNINPELVQRNHPVARRFIYSQETSKLRKFADVFAMFNSLMFKEVTYHERNYFRKMVQNFKEFESKHSKAVTDFHHVLADLSSNLNDIDRYTSKGPDKVEW